MHLRRTIEVADPGETIDNRIILHDVPWKEFERLLAVRGDRGSPRMSYLEGELELMSPSRFHEGCKSLIGRLLEAYAEELDIELDAFGGWTLKKRRRARGVEPDECYLVRGHDAPVPHLAIEVVWTSGGLDKLDVYRGLGVRELWIWENDELQIHGLRKDGYVPIEKSAVLPEIDVKLLASFVRPGSQSCQVKALRRAVRARLKRR